VSVALLRSVSRLEAYDELLETKALLRRAEDALPPRSRFRPWLERVQDDLVDVAADLVLPLLSPPEADAAVDGVQLAWLAAARDEAACLVAARPPGRPSEAGGRLAVAAGAAERTAASARAEAAHGPSNPLAIAYLERLVELLRLLSRAVDLDTGVRTLRPRNVVLLRPHLA
jgi:cob(I)alamin adenosyltransferase